MQIFKEFTFDAAHYLTKVPEGHKCAIMHGHTYHLRIWLKGQLNEQGWLMDFSEIKHITKAMLQKIDHQCLNKVEGLENPTCELLAVWIWQNLKPQLPLLFKVELQETPSSGVVYEGD